MKTLTKQIGYHKVFHPELEELCELFDSCIIRKITKRNCMDYKNCQTYKFTIGYKDKSGVPDEMKGEYKL